MFKKNTKRRNSKKEQFKRHNRKKTANKRGGGEIEDTARGSAAQQAALNLSGFAQLASANRELIKAWVDPTKSANYHHMSVLPDPNIKLSNESSIFNLIQARTNYINSAAAEHAPALYISIFIVTLIRLYEAIICKGDISSKIAVSNWNGEKEKIFIQLIEQNYATIITDISKGTGLTPQEILFMISLLDRDVKTWTPRWDRLPPLLTNQCSNVNNRLNVNEDYIQQGVNYIFGCLSNQNALNMCPEYQIINANAAAAHQQQTQDIVAKFRSGKVRQNKKRNSKKTLKK